MSGGELLINKNTRSTTLVAEYKPRTTFMTVSRQRVYSGFSGDVNGGSQTDPMHLELTDILDAPGVYKNPEITVDSKGRISKIKESNSISSLGLKIDEFCVESETQTSFILNNKVTKVVLIFVNQFEYSQFAQVRELGKTCYQIFFDPTDAPYIPQKEDFVRILWY